jgi:hypothetical protein
MKYLNRLFLTTLVTGPLLLGLLPETGSAGSYSVGDNGEQLMSPGTGWRSEAEKKAGFCATPFGTVSDAMTGRISLSLDADERSTADRLGLSVGGRARIGVVKYSLNADYLKESKSRGFSIAYNYSAQFKRNLRVNSALDHPLKPNAGFTAALKDGATWKDLCGDEVVTSIDQGAMLLVNIRMDFTTSEELMNFKSKVGASGPLFSTNLEVDLGNSSFNRNSKMTINLLQIGGDPSRLGQIFCGS